MLLRRSARWTSRPFAWDKARNKFYSHTDGMVSIKRTNDEACQEVYATLIPSASRSFSPLSERDWRERLERENGVNWAASQKTKQDLIKEAEEGECMFGSLTSDGSLVRFVQVASVRVLHGTHVLREVAQRRTGRTVVSRGGSFGRSLTEKIMFAQGEVAEDAFDRGIQEELGSSFSVTSRILSVDSRCGVRREPSSPSYVGLPSVYLIHYCTADVQGLPAPNQHHDVFVTNEKDLTTLWKWFPEADLPPPDTAHLTPRKVLGIRVHADPSKATEYCSTHVVSEFESLIGSALSELVADPGDALSLKTRSTLEELLREERHRGL